MCWHAARARASTLKSMQNQTDTNNETGAVDSSDLLAPLHSQLDAVKKEESRLGELFSAAKAERKSLEEKIARIKFKVEIGDIVDGGDGKEYRVTSIDPRWSRPWVKGNPRKKDGTWGTSERYLYDVWKHIPANDKIHP